MSIDAIACEKSNAELILKRKGHYLLALKKNQGLLYEQVSQLHWCLDTVFHEDQQRIRLGNGAENFATLRKLARQLLHRVDDKESIKSRRKLAGWDDQYLLNVLVLI